MRTMCSWLKRSASISLWTVASWPAATAFASTRSPATVRTAARTAPPARSPWLMRSAVANAAAR